MEYYDYSLHFEEIFLLLKIVIALLGFIAGSLLVSAGVRTWGK